MTRFHVREEEEDIGTSAVYIAVAYLQLNDIYIHVHVQGSLVLCIGTDNCTCLKSMYMKNTVTGQTNQESYIVCIVVIRVRL